MSLIFRCFLFLLCLSSVARADELAPYRALIDNLSTVSRLPSHQLEQWHARLSPNKISTEEIYEQIMDLQEHAEVLYVYRRAVKDKSEKFGTEALKAHARLLDKQMKFIANAVRTGNRPSALLGKMGTFSYYFHVQLIFRTIRNYTREEILSLEFQKLAHEALLAFEVGFFGLEVLTPKVAEERGFYQTLDQNAEPYSDGFKMFHYFQYNGPVYLLLPE